MVDGDDSDFNVVGAPAPTPSLTRSNGQSKPVREFKFLEPKREAWRTFGSHWNYKPLSEDHKTALENYTGEGFKSVNGHFRAGACPL